VLHENLDATGKPVSTEQRKFDYVVSITQLSSGDLNVEESRDGQLRRFSGANRHSGASLAAFSVPRAIPERLPLRLPRPG
jgi:hypothetical protein